MDSGFRVSIVSKERLVGGWVVNSGYRVSIVSLKGMRRLLRGPWDSQSSLPASPEEACGSPGWDFTVTS